MIYRAYNQTNFRDNELVKQHIPEEHLRYIETASMILPFKVNNYVIEQLIDWKNWENDPMYHLTFPQREMLKAEHFMRLTEALDGNTDPGRMRALVHELRLELNPHPAGQMEHNVPIFNGQTLSGIQHKYRQTVLFFPSHGQTCHSYCTFCFRWPQFTGMSEYKFATREIELLLEYLHANPQVTDLLFTGGDPMVMPTERFRTYIEPILADKPAGLQSIRIGSKSLSYWPYRFTADSDADDMLRLFESIVDSGINLAFMAHFNHPVELSTEEVHKAIARIRNTGAVINTQSPVMKNINDDSSIWETMWKEQVRLGLTPYYFFIARNTGAQEYFAVTLDRALQIYTEAYKNIGGLARTVRGPSMSAMPGKIHIMGISEIAGEKVFILRFIQGRDPEWVGEPFFAAYDPDAIWLTDLKPAFGKDKFFFED